MALFSALEGPMRLLMMDKLNIAAKGAFKKEGLEAIHHLMTIKNSWQLIVGEALSQKCLAFKIEKKTLTILAEDGAYISQLKARSDQLIALIRVLLQDAKAVRYLKVSVGNYELINPSEKVLALSPKTELQPEDLKLLAKTNEILAGVKTRPYFIKWQNAVLQHAKPSVQLEEEVEH